MSRFGIEENTLGVAVGRERKRRREDDTFQRSQRTVTVARARQTGLSGRHLILGITVAAGVLTCFQLLRFVLTAPLAPNIVPTIIAWVLLFAVTIGVQLTTIRLGMRMPNWLFAIAMVGAAIVVGLDLYAVWGHENLTVMPTAAAAAGALIAPLAAVRETRDVLYATGALCVTMLTAVALSPRESILMLGPEFLVIGQAVMPAIVAVGLIRGFRRMVERELDLTLVQSTVTAPAYGVGMLASEQLAQLDLDAEQLLVDVADGTASLPLSKEQAEHAAQLASALRRRLIARRTETWLHHAINESEFLAPAVEIDDPDGLAGLLDPRQRDGLLQALWLLVGDTPKAEANALVILGPIWQEPLNSPRRGIRFPIRIETRGVPRRSVEPGTWEAIGEVGPHTDSQHHSSVQIDIRCVVESPADR